MTLDIQVIDVNTCEPFSDVYIEVWNCNSTVSELPMFSFYH